MEPKTPCLNCEKQLSENFKFCPYCGYRRDNLEGKILYHYTTMETAFKILSNIDKRGNLTLHAGLYNSMNDPKDCCYLVESLKKIIPTISAISMQDEGIPYLVSFSLLGDDLHMWNCYGDNGHGVALGFDMKSLQRVDYRNDDSSPDFIKLHPCHYIDEDDIESFLRRYIDIEKLSGDVLSHLSYIFKHPCYLYEQEYRFVITSLKALAKLNKKEKLDDFLNVKIPKSALKEIVLGPSLKETLPIIREFEGMCKCSEIPYRTK